MVARSIESFWEDFRKTVMYPDSPPIQIKDMRTAFHAGFFSMLIIMDKIRQSDISDTVGMMYLSQLTKEMNDYMKKVKRNVPTS
jgi:hypothetical protein